MLASGAVGSIWLLASAGSVPPLTVAKASAVDTTTVATAAVAPVRRTKQTSDPRVLVLDQQTTAAIDEQAVLDEASIAAYWERKANAPLPSAVEETADYALAEPPMSLVAPGSGARPSWNELNAARQAGRLDILRRAMAAAGTGEGRGERLAFAAPSGGVNVVASLGTPVPAPEASIEISFVADLLKKTGPAPEVAALEPTVDESEVESQLAKLEDPFNEVLSTPEIDDVPLPSARPEIRTAKVEPEQTIPMRAQREPAAREAPKTLMAYARPSNPLAEEKEEKGGFSLFGNKRSTLPGRGSKIAVYDITAGVVHMPDGRKLKASSGRGEYRDNPKYVHVRMRGSTPPNVYHLRMREALFHGVEAIRMTPVNQKMMFGRDGMLTHSYLLRRRGDSSGCVVFANYPDFLNAFKRGEVKTLIVVPKIDELNKYMAML